MQREISSSETLPLAFRQFVDTCKSPATRLLYVKALNYYMKYLGFLTTTRDYDKLLDVLSYLRCIAQVWETKDSQGSEYAFSISQREVPRRATTALSNLARGRALSKGRNYITLEDIQIVIKTALDGAQIERVSIFSLLLANHGTLTTNQILRSLNVSRKTALRTMAEFKAIGLAELEDFHEPGQNAISKRITLNSRLNWLLEDSMITKIFPHTTPFSFSKEEEKEEEEVTSDMHFWIIYNQLEAQNGNGKVINHDQLHEALVSSGKFYVGDATQIISDMVEAGKLETISFNEYRKTE